MTPTSLATLGQIVARVLEMYALDAPAMFKRHGIDPALLSNPNARIPSRTWDSLARDAAAHIPDPAFGLLAARCWHPSNLGALGYAWLTSSTLRTGLERLVRYWRLLGEASSTRLEESSAGFTIVLARQAPDPVSSAVTVDFVMSLLVDMCRMNAGSSLRPVAVRLRRKRPEHSEAYRRHFGCVVHFAADEDSFTLSRRDVDRPLPTSNRQLAATLDRILTEQLAHLDKRDVVARCQAPHEPSHTPAQARRGGPHLPEAGRRHAARPRDASSRGPAALHHRRHLPVGLLTAKRFHARIQALDWHVAQRVPRAAFRGRLTARLFPARAGSDSGRHRAGMCSHHPVACG
jgi:Arabinose-binding domain of AraC transcription regulator, N-term